MRRRAHSASLDESIPQADNRFDLAPGSTYTLTAPDNDTDGPNGLPTIVGDITINGHGATIQRSTDSGTPEFRIIRVDPTGILTLQRVTLRNGQAFTFGGGVTNRGTLTIDGSTLAANSAFSGGAVAWRDGGTGSPDRWSRPCPM